tara:strand:+ start:243 stop:632 length:390 start_codon:yes stop_codon:yes gene_type:complete
MKQLSNQITQFILSIVKSIRESKAALIAFALMIIHQSNLYSQGLIDKLQSGQSEASEVAGEGVDAFMGYVDIFAAVLLVFWIVQAFRQSRANSDDDSGEGFSLIKWGSWRAGVIIFYAIARTAIIPNLF